MAQCVLNNAFSGKEDAARQARTNVADQIYIDVYGSHIEVMSVLPKGFLDTSNFMYIAIAGQEHFLNLQTYNHF